MSIISFILDECVRRHVTHVGIAPGSRSSQIVHSILTKESFKINTHIDERSLAFWALGVAKLTKIPAIICCTSGTAVSNLLPAVIEAAESETPMIIISADRSLSEQSCGSNQTIETQQLPLEYLSAYLEQDECDTTDESQANVRSALAFLHGPIQFNIRCQDPNPSIFQSVTHKSSILKQSSRIVLDPSDSRQYGTCQTLIENAESGAIVVGQCQDQYSDLILKLAEAYQWPIIPDIQSNLRFLDHPLIVSHHEMSLFSELSLAPVDTICWIGQRMISKRLLSWMAPSSVVQFSESRYRCDAGMGGVQRLVAPLADALVRAATWAVRTPPPVPHYEHKQMLNISESLKKQGEKILEELPFSEPWIHVMVSEVLKSNQPFFIGNSLSIRLANMVATTRKGTSPIVLANRGASGIDGLLSTAIGCANASGLSSMVLLGDMSFAYDMNALIMLAKSEIPIQVFVMNNGGGDIFRQLSQAEEKINERYWVQDPQICIESAAKMVGVSYQLIESKDALKKSLRSSPKTKIIECKVDPKWTREWFERVAELSVSTDSQE